MEASPQQKIELLAKEVCWKLGHRLPCSKCAEWKPKEELMSWRPVHKSHGTEFICRGAKFWGCDKIKGLSVYQMIELGKQVDPDEVEKLERGMCLSVLK